MHTVDVDRGHNIENWMRTRIHVLPRLGLYTYSQLQVCVYSLCWAVSKLAM